jgi:hypothetical protein
VWQRSELCVALAGWDVKARNVSVQQTYKVVRPDADLASRPLERYDLVLRLTGAGATGFGVTQASEVLVALRQVGRLPPPHVPHR